MDQKVIADQKEIADNFNVFLANIGAKLTACNNQSNFAQLYSDYLNNPKPHMFTLSTINKSYILSIINRLKNKNSRIVRYQTNYLKLLEMNYLNH